MATSAALMPGDPALMVLYIVQFGVVTVGKRLFVRANTMVDEFENLARQFQARVRAA